MREGFSLYLLARRGCPEVWSWTGGHKRKGLRETEEVEQLHDVLLQGTDRKHCLRLEKTQGA